MTYDELTNGYWKYYIMLESKFIESLKYVELNETNYSTYSIEFANQLISIGSELDVFFKVISDFNLNDKKNMRDYYTEIIKCYPNIKNQEVSIIGKINIKIRPFEYWEEECPAQSLSWWNAYNKVKHGRSLNFTDANLGNVLNILGALFILEMYFYKKIYDANTSDIIDKCDVPEEGSSILFLENWDTHYKPSKSGSIAGKRVIESLFEDL